MRILIYILLYLTIGQNLLAQQSSIYNQAADEFGFDNPAGLSMEGIRFEGLQGSVTYRSQWMKLDVSGLPRTFLLNLLDNGSCNSLYGLFVGSDKIGETTQTSVLARYAHNLDEGLRIGVSAGWVSDRIAVEELNQYDPGDPVAMQAGNSRSKLAASAGIFYRSRITTGSPFSWFGGLSFRYATFLSDWQGSSAPPEEDLLLQGGIRWNKLWIGARIRNSFDLPDALDAYARVYTDKLGSKNNFFIGAIFTSDETQSTVGGQAGYESNILPGGRYGGHFLIVSTSFSKPMTQYVYGNHLIFDFKLTYTWQRARKKGGKPCKYLIRNRMG